MVSRNIENPSIRAGAGKCGRKRSRKPRSRMTYCVGCCRKTPTYNSKVVRLQNGVCALKGGCSICTSLKYKFVSPKFARKWRTI
uniref:DUF5679 domain-containing protein n=1 Tax=Octopus bimaculoides TaxID=37653 RepID=A0A0L8FW39_OCTBM